MWKGDTYSPCQTLPSKSPPLMQALTSSQEVFNYQLHVGDVGHTLIFGPTSSGKSVLMGKMAAHFLKYPGARVIYFDKKRPVRNLCHALGGQYHILGGADGCGVAPLQDIHSLGRMWAINWVENFIKLGGVDLRPSYRTAIQEAVDTLMDLGPLTFEQLRIQLQDKALMDVIERYVGTKKQSLQSNENEISQNKEQPKTHSTLLNDSAPELVWNAFTVFETDDLFKSDLVTRSLVLDYLFARIEQQFDGTPLMIVFDEAWAYLEDPLFFPRIREWLKEARKQNVSIVFATQALNDVTSLDDFAALSESCKTKIYLANRGAKSESSEEQYRALGLNTAQIDLVSSIIPKRDYLIHQQREDGPMRQRVVDFNLGPGALKIVGKTHKSDAERAAGLVQKDPDYWEKDVDKALKNITEHDNTEEGV